MNTVTINKTNMPISRGKNKCIAPREYPTLWAVATIPYIGRSGGGG